MNRVPPRRLRTVVAVIAMMAFAVTGLRLSEPDDAQIVRGVLDEPIEVRGGTVEVTQVRVGDEVKNFGTVTPTEGMFVVVAVTGTAPGRDPLRLPRASLLTSDGVSYQSMGVSNGVSVKPGFTVAGDLAFEVDPERIDDLTLNLEPVEVVAGYQQHVRIQLGISDANAADWRAAAAGVRVERGRDVERGLP